MTEKYIGGKKIKIEKLPLIEAWNINGLYRLAEMQKKAVIDDSTLYRLMACASIERAPGQWLPLNSKMMIENHVPDLASLNELENEALRINGIEPLRGEAEMGIYGLTALLDNAAVAFKPLIEEVGKAMEEGLKEVQKQEKSKKEE